MIYITIEEAEFGILFKHDRLIKDYPANPAKNLLARKQAHPFRTSCVLFKDEVPLGTGIAKVDSRDHFEYEKGRRISLKAALDAAGIPRDERAELWSGYSGR